MAQAGLDSPRSNTKRLSGAEELLSPDNPPQAIVFYAGDNDIAAGHSVGQVLASFDAFMATKRERLGNTPVYFVSIKPSPERWRDRKAQAAVNEGVQKLVEEQPDLHFVDVVPAMMKDGKPGPYFRRDGVHMTDAGYAIWASILRHVLSEYTKNQQAGRCRV